MNSPKHKNKRITQKPVHLVPREPGRNMMKIRGGDVIETLMLAKDPNALSKDILLLRAKHAAKQAKAGHLSISELRGVSWFAHVPELSGDLTKALFNEANFYAGSFWAVWQRDPETVLRLAAKIRSQLKAEKLGDVIDVIMQPSLYSASGHAARKKAVQRARKHLKPPPHIAKFASLLRQHLPIRRTK